MLRQEGIKLLSTIEHDRQSFQEDMPSRTADWRMRIVQNSLGYYPEFHFRTSCDGVGGAFLEIGDSSISIHEIPFDDVVYTCRFSKEEKDWDVAKAGKALRGLQSFDTVFKNPLASINDTSMPCAYSDSSKTDALSLTLCTGLMNYERAETDIERHRKMFEEFCKVRQRIRDPQAIVSSNEKEDSLADLYWYDLSLGRRGRCFFITKRGYYGLGPWIMQPLDQCWLIKGSRVPFILRAAEDGKSFRLIGEGYIHGIMEGELVRDDLAWETLRIV